MTWALVDPVRERALKHGAPVPSARPEVPRDARLPAQYNVRSGGLPCNYPRIDRRSRSRAREAIVITECTTTASAAARGPS